MLGVYNDPFFDKGLVTPHLTTPVCQKIKTLVAELCDDVLRGVGEHDTPSNILKKWFNIISYYDVDESTALIVDTGASKSLALDANNC
eukprot:9355194-Ditylum_brightwellii.AAC.1